MNDSWFDWKWEEIKEERTQKVDNEHNCKKDSNWSNVRAFVH